MGFLKIKSDDYDTDFAGFTSDDYQIHCRIINKNKSGRAVSSALVSLNKHKARQLHEWLGRYLENKNG